MKSFKLFCFGFGQVAKYFVENLIKNNYKFELVTTNTTNTQEKKIKNLIYKSYFFKNEKFDEGLLKDLNSRCVNILFLTSLIGSFNFTKPLRPVVSNSSFLIFGNTFQYEFNASISNSGIPPRK